jgi:AcrR family transcriptional regulator
MKEKPYHHGNLQTELIEEGLALIHEEGKGNFSLRKLAKRIGVSPTACYNHYATVDELLNEMKSYVTKKFCDALTEDVDQNEIENATINMGKSYVRFFANNPHYFSFIYDNEDYKIQLTENTFDSDFEPFCIFKKIGLASMQSNHVEKEKYHDNLIVMWATVHGLAAMANMKGFCYDGDWGVLTEKILLQKIIL